MLSLLEYYDAYDNAANLTELLLKGWITPDSSSICLAEHIFLKASDLFLQWSQFWHSVIVPLWMRSICSLGNAPVFFGDGETFKSEVFLVWTVMGRLYSRLLCVQCFSWISGLTRLCFWRPRSLLTESSIDWSDSILFLSDLIGEVFRF